MPTASGSLAFLGAARFQGFWNANSNNAEGSGLTGAPSGDIGGLFLTGTSTSNGGYALAHNTLTASAGDYWQVTGSGTHNVDGVTSWRLNDFCIYSGSAGATGDWIKLAFEDTIASIVLGDITANTTFNLTGSADKQILFISGTTDAVVRQSGSNNFTFDHANNNLLLTGNLHIADDNKIIFGANQDASLRYDEDDTDTLIYDGASLTFNGTSLKMADDKKLEFGTAADAHIEYNENGDDFLIASGS